MSDVPSVSADVLAAMIDELAHAVVVTTADGEVILWNAGAEALFGWPRSQVLGTQLGEVVAPVSAQPARAGSDSVLPYGRADSVESWLPHRDGSLIPVLERRSTVDDAAGARPLQLIEMHDVSDRVSLRRQLEGIFDTAPHGWAFTDLNGRFTAVNDALCEILGRSRSEILGHLPPEFTAAADGSRVAPFAAMATGATEDTFACRKRVVRPDGSLRWVDVDVRLERDHNGRPQHFLGHVVDVTDWIDSADRYRHLFNSVVASFAASHELSDPFTAGHQQRVARLATAIGANMGLDRQQLEGLTVGALLHDIGKVATPVQILIKPGRLDPPEYDLVKRHPRDGHDIVAHIDFPWPIAAMIRQHHERMDGSGYPNRLSGDEILLESRIIAVADTVETISSHRPYKTARPLQVGLDVIAKERARLFDADVVDACLTAFDNGFALERDS